MPGGWIDPLHFIESKRRNPGLDEHRLTQDFQFKRNTQTSYLAGALVFFRGKIVSWNICQFLSNQKTPKFCLLVMDLPLVRWGKDMKINIQRMCRPYIGTGLAELEHTCGFLPVMLVFESQNGITENMAHGFCIDVACICQHVKNMHQFPLICTK